MKEYKYEVELIEELPENIPLVKSGTISVKEEWYGHAFADAVGRIYEDGTVESFFNKDNEDGNTNLFNMLRESGLTRTKNRYLVNKATGREYSCQEHYVMRKVKGHSSGKPTVTDLCLDHCRNIEYEYVYEVLLVADGDCRRYVTNSVRTDGAGLYCLMDEIKSMEDIFEEWEEEGRNGFREEDGSLMVLFYDDFGEETEVEFYNMDDLLRCINSIRIISLKENKMDKSAVS